MNTHTIEQNTQLHLEDIYKSYGDKLILDDIDLHVSDGEFCTVVGPSGCGKSTLLRLILGQEEPDPGSGKIEINGQQVGSPDPSRGIVYQRYALYPHLTVLENVCLGKVYQSGAWWKPVNKYKPFVEEAMYYLERVRLADAKDKYPHELSGGMQQRVAIAQALICKPPILMMDEPFGALDPDTRQDAQLYLLELWEKEKLTIFFVTHDMVEACFLGTRLLVLSQYYSDDRAEGERRGGKIVADYALPPCATSTEVLKRDEFIQLIEQIKSDGFNPAHRQHLREFNLSHSDSFRTP